MGTTLQEPELDKFLDMSWSISPNSGIIMLDSLPNVNELYVQQTTTAAVGLVWQNHHREFAKFLAMSQPSAVLEIGGAHGILSIEYEKVAGATPWTIIEPNPAPLNECKAIFIEKFFEECHAVIEKTHTIVHSHTLEHIYNPYDFLVSIANQMQVKQKMVVSVPNLKQWFLRGHANALNFEHTYLLTENASEVLFVRAGFEVLDKQHFNDTHSIFYQLEYVGKVAEESQLGNLIEKDLEVVFKRILQSKRNFIAKCNDEISQTKQKIFLFGAHIFSQELINLGLRLEKITGIIDNDKNKVGKRLYGTPFLVFPVSAIDVTEGALVILHAGEYQDEICLQLKTLNSKVNICSSKEFINI